MTDIFKRYDADTATWRPVAPIDADLGDYVTTAAANGAYVPALVADADTYGDGVTDATSYLQGLIDTLETRGGGTLYLTPGYYLVAGILQVSTPSISIIGPGARAASNNETLDPVGNSSDGAWIIADTASGSAGDPVLWVSPLANWGDVPSPGGSLRGVSLSGFNIHGAGEDRVGLAYTHVTKGAVANHITISGFPRQGLFLEKLYDATFTAVDVIQCGTDDTYAAIHIKDSGGSDQSNSLHFFGCTVEGSPYHLNMEAARTTQFFGCKFHIMQAATSAYVGSPIQLGADAERSGFVGCHFRAWEADDAAWASEGDPPAMFSMASGATLIDFDDCQFVTSAGGVGGRWFDAADADNCTIANSFFQRCWGGDAALKVGEQWTLNNVKADVVPTSTGVREFIEMDSGTSVVDPLVFDSTSAAVSSGNLFTLINHDCTVVRPRIDGNVSTVLSNPTSKRFRVVPYLEAAVTFTDGDTTPSVGWSAGNLRGGSQFRVSNTSSTTISDLDDGLNGQVVYLVQSSGATAGNTTIQTGVNIFTKTGANVTMAANTVFAAMRFNSKWYEV